MDFVARLCPEGVIFFSPCTLWNMSRSVLVSMKLGWETKRVCLDRIAIGDEGGEEGGGVASSDRLCFEKLERFCAVGERGVVVSRKRIVSSRTLPDSFGGVGGRTEEVTENMVTKSRSTAVRMTCPMWRTCGKRDGACEVQQYSKAGK